MYFTEGYVNPSPRHGRHEQPGAFAVSKADKRAREGSERTLVRDALRRATSDPYHLDDDRVVREVGLARQKPLPFRAYTGQMGRR